MICVDNESSRGQKKLGICIHESDIGLQRQIRRKDRLLASCKLVLLCMRRKKLLQCIGLTIIFLLLVLVIFAMRISNMAFAAFPDESFMFFSIGNFGSRSVPQFKVARQMGFFAARMPVKFVTGLGDNFYDIGVKDLEDRQLVDKFWWMYNNQYLSSIPWYMALGDHDHIGNISAQVEFTQRCPFWKMKAPYFVEHIKHNDITLDLIVTDSVGIEGALLRNDEQRRFGKYYTEYFTDEMAGMEQLMWLEETLKDSNADWIIVTGHRPLFSVANRDRFPVENRMHMELMPWFRKYGVDMYLHGHDHVGQHSIRDWVHHIGNRVGGYGNQDLGKKDRDTIWARTHYYGFCVHEVMKNYMKIAFIDTRGKVLHQATIKRKTGSEHPSAHETLVVNVV